MLPTEELCIKIYCSMGICMIFKLTESQVDVSYKYMNGFSKYSAEEWVRRIYVLHLVVESFLLLTYSMWLLLSAVSYVLYKGGKRTRL